MPDAPNQFDPNLRHEMKVVDTVINDLLVYVQESTDDAELAGLMLTLSVSSHMVLSHLKETK